MQNIIKKSIWLKAFTLLSASCVTESSKPEKGGLKKFYWFGSWSGEISESIFTETWEKVNNTLFSGQSYFIKGIDTLSRETISLRQKGNWYFICLWLKDRMLINLYTSN